MKANHNSASEASIVSFGCISDTKMHLYNIVDKRKETTPCIGEPDIQSSAIRKSNLLRDKMTKIYYLSVPMRDTTRADA